MEYRREPMAVPVARGMDPWRPEIVEFVRQAYRRRPVAWPDLYDELTRMASRGTFRGLGFCELAELGLSFSLSELPKLALLTNRVAAEEEALGVPAAAMIIEEPAEPVAVAVGGVPMVRFEPRLVRRVPPPVVGIGPRLSVVRGVAG